MLKVVNFLRGYREVEISGPYPERFLNICSRNGISFWRMDRIGPNRLTARVRVLEYDRLKAFAQNALCEVKTVSRKGAPFFVWRFRKRTFFIAGFILFVASLYFLSQRIWEIDVEGNQSVSEERIVKTLEQIGVGVGMPASKIDPEQIENLMMLQIRELRWLTVNVHGSRATVEVRERKEPPVMTDLKTPCNIVAGKAGIIVKIDVLEGSCQAAVGDTVGEGQLLAGGVVDTATGARFVHANARVRAKTWYTLTAKMPRTISIKRFTGETKHKYALIVAGKRLNLYFGSSISHDRCDKMIRKTQWTLPGGFVLPFVWTSEEYSEYTAEPGQTDRKVAEMILRDNLQDRLRALAVDGEVTKTDFTFGADKQNYGMTLMAECLEEIAKTVDIPILKDRGG